MSAIEDQTFNRNLEAKGRAAFLKQEREEVRALQKEASQQGLSLSRSEAKQAIKEQKAAEEKERDRLMQLVRDARPEWTKNGGISGGSQRIDLSKPEIANADPSSDTSIRIANAAHVPGIAFNDVTGNLNGSLARAIGLFSSPPRAS